MYPVSSVTSSVAASVGAPDSGDDGGTNGVIVRGGDLRQVEVTTLPATVGKGVSTSGKAQKLAAYLDIFSSLGVVLSSDSAQVVEGIFLKADAFARLAYKRMVAKQLPASVSEKLTITGRAVWYFTYRAMCENNFVSRCIGEYYYKHRPDFIRSLPSIQVLSSSPDRSLIPLTGDRLSDFLSRLDCAIHSRVKSVFNSCWSEVSVNLEEESLNAISCKDFTDVLDIAGIPPLALSAMIAAGAGFEINGGTGKCTASEFIQFSSVGDPDGESSYDPTGVKRRKDGGSVPVPTCSEKVTVRAPVWMPPSSEPTCAEKVIVRAPIWMPPSYETDVVTSSTITSPSARVSLSVKSVYLLGIKLNPDSAKLINNIFNKSRKFVKRSFSQSIFSYILTILNSELPVIGKAIWFKTYKELHLSKFMCRFICMYHYKHHPSLIRALDSIRVLSSSSDSRLVPLSGVELLDFLSKLDCAIRKEVESVFDLKWNEVADKVFSELEGGLLGNVSCGDFINVLDVVGVPVVAFPTSQRYGYIRPVVSKRKRLGSGSECAVDATKSRSLSLPEGVCDQSSSKTKTASTTLAITTGKGVARTVSKSKGKVPALKCGTYYIDSDVLNSLGVILSPKVVRVIECLFFKMDAFARRTYKSMVAKQLPSDVSSKLTVTGRAIWYLTYKVMCEGSFVFKCLGKYHYKHRPSFIRVLPSIQVLSDSPDYGAAPLAGDGLLDFLSVLDGAISSKVKSIFNSCWSEVSVSLEEGGLSAVSCKDLIDVLDTAGIPHLALSAVIATNVRRERSKDTNKCTTSEISVIPPLVLEAMIAASAERERNKGIDKCTTSEINITGLKHFLPSSSQSLSLQSNPGLSPRAHSQSKSQLGSSLPLMEAAGTSPELILPSSVVDYDDGSSSNKCVDLLGVKLHPDSAKLVLQLLHDIDKSFRISFLHSIRGYILETLGSELSAVEKAIWCRTYREQHLYRFMHRSICIYHSKYRPSFIRALDGVRVLSSSPDCRLVPLIGGELLSFLSELDCTVHKTVEYIFDSLWNKITDKVFAELEDGSLSDVSCGDFIRVLDVAGIPVVAFSIYQVHNNKNARRRAKRLAISESKTSESSSKRVKGKGSVIDTTDLTHSSVASFSQLQPELTLQLQIQPEFSLTLVTESVAMPTVSDPTVSDQSASASVTDTISISVVLPDAESPSVTESVAMQTLPSDSFLIISGDVLVSVAEGAASDLVVEGELSVEPSSSFSPLPAPASDLVVASDVLPPLSPSAKGLFAADVVSASMGAEDDSLSPPSSPSIEPSSSSSSLSSSPSSSGLDADISFSSSSPGSPA